MGYVETYDYEKGHGGRAHSKLHSYQRQTVDMMHESGQLALLMDPGLGKTGTCLVHFHELYQSVIAERALVVAPLRVMKSTWPTEMGEWEHLGGYSHFSLHGARAWENLQEAHKAHITFINPEGLEKFVKNQAGLPRYDVLYVDESTYFKTASSKRTKAMLKIAHKVNGGISQRFILTGTPRPNGVEDLYAQFAILNPEILGKTLTAFRSNFGFSARRTHWGVEWEPTAVTEKLIEDRIAPHLAGALRDGPPGSAGVRRAGAVREPRTQDAQPAQEGEGGAVRGAGGGRR